MTTTSPIDGIGVIAFQDTLRNILVNDTPVTGQLAWATDYNVLLAAFGSVWYVDSSYLTLKPSNPDVGLFAYNNRIGYAPTYITDKEIDNCNLGGNSTTTAGGLRYNATGVAGTSPSVQAYFSGQWNNLVANLNLIEAGGILEQSPPVGYTQTYQVFSGNSTALGLNGIPLVQGYVASLGAYPPLADVSAGAFNSSATQQSVTGSTSGTATFSQPFHGSSYSKVIINCAALLGTASYTFPFPFTNTPVVLSTSGLATSLVTTLNTTTVVVTGTTSTGILIIEGY